VDERPELFMLGSSGYGPRFAAVNGMKAVFAHHMSPDIAVDALRAYRAGFTPHNAGDEPYSAISVLAFASEEDDAVAEFEAAWALTMRNIRSGNRTPIRPEEVHDYLRSPEFSRADSDGRMVTGRPKDVAVGLQELKAAALADEVVVVTPGLNRDRRIASYQSIADAWREAI
jgi:alkanesulfonate monooxygenase SsuD/methylene tetrahydromethanopterin reductase-like flavin-dependent oxidoreductase (luciferase family)